jgi:DNA-binding FrmR family transcriptional regulator
MFIITIFHPPGGDMMASRHKSRNLVENRLARIEGHVKGLRRMVSEERECPELLIQISAVRSALDKVARIVLTDHIETCVIDAVKSGKPGPKLEELRAALSTMF